MHLNVFSIQYILLTKCSALNLIQRLSIVNNNAAFLWFSCSWSRFTHPPPPRPPPRPPLRRSLHHSCLHQSRCPHSHPETCHKVSYMQQRSLPMWGAANHTYNYNGRMRNHWGWLVRTGVQCTYGRTHYSPSELGILCTPRITAHRYINTSSSYVSVTPSTGTVKSES